MWISEQSRHELYRRLEEILGPGPAATLMEHLPPVGWADVATKRDVEAMEARLQGRFDREFGQLREDFGHLREDFGRLREDFGGVREEFGCVHESFGGVREEFGRVHDEFGGVREEFGRVHEEFGRVHESIASWGRTIVLTNVASVMAAVGFAFAAARLSA